MCYIAIDLGSSFAKLALLDAKTDSVLKTRRHAMLARIPCADEHIHEMDMDAIMGVVLEGLNDLRRDEKIDGILLSTQMHGFVLSGPRIPREVYISWQDARCLAPMAPGGQSYMEHLSQLIRPEDMRNCGVYLKPALALCNLYAYKEQQGADILQGAALDSLGSRVIFHLTGRRVCHLSNAAPMGLADIETCTWREDLLKKAGIPPLSLPRLADDLEPCGLWNGIPVYPDVGDVQTAVLGGGAEENDVVANMATASQVIMVRARGPLGGRNPAVIEVRPYFGGKYLHTISRMPGGRNLEVLIAFLREAGERIYGASLETGEIWQRILKGFAPGDSHGLSVDVGFYELPERLEGGCIGGINRANLTLDNLINAAMRDMGGIYKRYVDMLCEGTPAHSLIFCGGAIRNNLHLQRQIAQAIGLPWRLSAMDDEVFRGHIRIARSLEGLQTL